MSWDEMTIKDCLILVCIFALGLIIGYLLA